MPTPPSIPERFGRAAFPFWPRYLAQLALILLVVLATARSPIQAKAGCSAATSDTTLRAIAFIVPSDTASRSTRWASGRLRPRTSAAAKPSTGVVTPTISSHHGHGVTDPDRRVDTGQRHEVRDREEHRVGVQRGEHERDECDRQSAR